MNEAVRSFCFSYLLPKKLRYTNGNGACAQRRPCGEDRVFVRSMSVPCRYMPGFVETEGRRLALYHFLKSF